MSGVPRPAGVRGGPGRPVETVRGRLSRPRRALAGALVLVMTTGVLNGQVPTAASAAGTVVFSQSFRNNTANGVGDVVLPATPSGSGTTNLACLTASGNTGTGDLISCTTNLDSPGSGRLRLTHATTNRAGGLFGAVSVPTSQGLDVSFTTYQYGGTGADGMAFVLAGVNPANPKPPANLGQLGGGLGYSGTVNLPGTAYGYMGIGFDVYGNYSTTGYQGSGCTNPPYIGSARIAGQVTIRGPGNNSVGYCAIDSTATSSGSAALPLRAATRSAVPVQVGINPTATTLTTTLGMSIPPGSYKVVITLVGGATRTLTGTLPAVPAGLYPSTWVNTNGIPRQLAFGWVASTGSITDFHEIDNARVATISAVPELTVAQTSYNAATLQPGDPVTYTVVAGVTAALAETSPVTITHMMPAGTVPVGAYGTGWVCSPPSSRSVTCTNFATPFAAGATLPPLTIVGIVTGTGVTPAQIQSESVVTASSNDANPAYLSTTTAGTLPATPGGIVLSPAQGTIAGGGTVLVSGTNITGATAIEIGTVAQQEAGTPVVLLPCPTGVTAGCFVNNGNGTLTIPSMPARSTPGVVNVNVVTRGLDASAAYTYTSVPATPVAPVAVAGAAAATVSWTAPASNGSPITGYVVTPTRNGVAQTPLSFDASATSRTLTGLTVGATYTFTVTAVNAVGTGAASPASNAVVPYAVPGRPTITSVTAGTSSAVLAWTAPAANSSPITSYVVTPYVGGVAQPTQTFDGTATTQRVTGLTPGTSYTFTVTAVNAAGPGPASLASAAAVPNVPPAFTFAAPPAGEAGVAYSVPLTVAGGTTPYTWSVSTGALPPGLSLNATTGVLSGTPTLGGTYSFTAQVTDASTVSTTRAVTLVITPAPVLTFPAPPGGEVSVPYSVPLTVTGGTAPYVWSITAGGLPPGLSLNTSTGVLSGTPTLGGEFSFSVRVTDSFNQTSTRTVSVTIAALPAFTFAAPPPGQVGVAYSVPLTVGGGVAPYTWSVSAGALPPGLSLNTSTGVLSGTPTTTGSTTLTFRVVDGGGLADTRSVTLVITAGALVMTKTAGTSSAAPGGTVTYTITVNNTGTTAFTGATLSDPLAGVLDDATYNGDATASGGSVSLAGQTLTWTGNVAAGGVVTITYSVTVNTPDTGNKVLSNAVTSTTTGSTCPAGGADPRCSATVTVSGLSIVKAAAVSTAIPGQRIGYTITVTNNGQTPYTGATFTDALAGLLDDAVYNTDATATSGALSYTSPNLTWSGNLAPGASATIVYSATVKTPDTGNRTLSNTISSTTPGSTCPPGNLGPQCAATVAVLIPGLTITSMADVATTTPGSVVNYTFTFSNTGQTAYTGTSVTVSIVDLLDDATGIGEPTATSGTVVVNPDGTGTWTGDLAVGATATVTASVTVNDPDTGDRVLRTFAVSSAPGSNCPAGGQAPGCFSVITVLVPALTITKTADTSTTTPGSAVNYTVTATNTGQTAYTGATFADALAGLLDDATYNANAAATAGSVGFAGSTLTWTGDLAAGASATVTYSVTVAASGTGDGTLTNVLTSATVGSNCPAGGGDARCAATVTLLLPRLTLTAQADVATATPGDVVRFTTTMVNTGQTAYAGISVTIDIRDVADDTTYNGDLTTSSGTINLTPDGTVIWTGDIAIGATVTIAGSVTVNEPNAGDRVLRSTVTSAAPGSTCPVVGATAPGCFSVVTVLVPGLTITNTADTQTIAPGAKVTYTTTVTNTGQTPYGAAQVVNRLAQVLGDAAYSGDAVATAGTVAFAGSDVTWTGALAVGASATITYSVTVNDPDLGDRVMRNVAVSSTPGSTCPAGSLNTACTSTVLVLVPGLTIAASANTATTTPGAVVGYTTTVTNSGQTSYTGATVTGLLAGVLDDADYNGDAAATAGTVSLSGSGLTWTGNLAAGASATITYSVTVDTPDTGDALLSSTAVSSTTGSNCPVGGIDPRCTVQVAVARLAISQVLTGTATPGATVTVTATFTNTGQVPYTGISVTRPLSGITDDAIPNGDQTATSGTLVATADSLVWTGNIPVGGVVTVTRTLLVKNPPTGDRNITSTLVSAAPGNNCPAGGSDPACTFGGDVVVPGLTITKTADTAATVQGAPVGYTITVVNSGQTAYTGATFTDPLAGVLDDAVYNADATATTGTLGFAAGTLTWTGDLAPGASATIAYTVTVRAPDPGDKTMVNTISSPTTGANCSPASGDARCTGIVAVLVPALTIVKSSNPATAVPGATVAYTIVATNTGPLPYTGATFTDVMAGVLDDAAYGADATATTGTVGLSGSDLTWTGDLAPGASATVSYTAVVDNPATGDLNLTNTVTSATPGNNCPPGGTDQRCVDSVPVTNATTLTFDKVASTVSAAQGDIVTYTVTISNTGLTPFAGATFTDALAGVLDDATYNGDAVAGTGDVAYTAPDLTWTGTVPAEGSTTVVYSVTVSPPASGDGMLTNTLVSDSAGGNCGVGGTDPRCAETVTVASLSIVTTSDAATYLPGDVIWYTTTITNTGQTPYSGISVMFQGPEGVDDTVPNGDQAATSGSLSLTLEGLTWTGNIPVGGSVTLTGSVTVNDPDLGDRLITLTSVSTAQGSSCPVASAPGCTTSATVLTPGLTITKVADRSTVVPGGAVAYTLTIANSGDSAYTGAVVTDTMTGVLDEATYNGDAAATTGTVGVANAILTWTGDLAAGASATVTYSVTADLVAIGGKVLVNTAASTEQGSTCPPASGNVACAAQVVILTPILAITKTTGATSAVPGATVAYTVTAVNTGQVPFAAATFTDALAGVLDDAVYDGNASATRGTVVLTGSGLTWTGALDPGQAVTVAYSITVANPGTGDQRLVNAVTSTTAGSTCPTGGTDPRCAADVPISRVTITTVTDVTTAVPGQVVNYTVTATNTGQTPYLDVVVDGSLLGTVDDAVYNGDGAVTVGSFVLVPQTRGVRWRLPLAAGASATATFSFTVSDPDPGDKVMTSVIVSDTPGTNCPIGSADPACTSTVTVLTPALTLSKSTDRTTVTPGGVIDYTITIANTGQTPYTGATATDDMSAVLTDASYNGDASATSGTVTIAGSDLNWSGDLAIGATATITYSVTVLDPDPGDKRIDNRVFSDTPGSTCPSAGDVVTCTALVAVLTPALTIVKTAAAVTTTPGATVGYTITATNGGQTDQTGVTITDPLAGVLDDAAYNGDATATAGTVALIGQTLTWTGDLAIGVTVTIAYSVTVGDPDTGDRSLTGTVSSSAPGSTCPAGTTAPACVSTVTVLVPGLAVSVAADRATTTPGGIVRFTVTIANTGQTPYSGASVVNSLAEVLGGAVYNEDETATTGTIGLAGQNLTWTGDLPVGTTAIVTYTVTAADPNTGDTSITSVVSSSAPGSTCPVGGTAPACTSTVTVLIPALSIAMTADTATTTPGGTVGYTITLTNTGQTAYDDASVVAALDGLLADAVYNGDASASTGVFGYTAPNLTWTGSLAVGASTTITYSVTVRNPDPGDKVLTSAVTSAAPGSTCPAGGTAPACTTSVRVLVPELTITQAADAVTVVAGETVTYTVTLVNDGETDQPGAAFTVPLAGVLDDAVYAGGATATAGTVTYAAGTLSWIGALPVGEAATVTYSVTTIEPPPGNRLLTSTVGSTTAGATCPAGGDDPRCTTTVAVLAPGLAITKTADSSGAVVGGATVRYTITVTNTGEAPYAEAAFTDSLAGVLDDAVYAGDAATNLGTVTYADGVLGWSGALPVAASAVVTFSVLVTREGTGDAVLDNRVTSATAGSTCPVAGTDPGCSVQITVAPTSITLVDLDEAFTLRGTPNSTVTVDQAVTMTVVTNNFDGYAVTVRAASPAFTSDQPGNDVTIPIGNLRVREYGTQDFLPLSTTTPILVREQPVPSAPAGDAIGNDFEADIPFVPVGTYSATLTYAVMAR